MGGVAAAAGATIAAKNLIESQNEYKTQSQTLKQQYQYDLSNRRNLLKEQLASRRARIGAMGLTDSASSSKVQERLIRDHYSDSAMEDLAYKNQLLRLKSRQDNLLQNSLLNSASSYSSSIK